MSCFSSSSFILTFSSCWNDVVLDRSWCSTSSCPDQKSLVEKWQGPQQSNVRQLLASQKHAEIAQSLKNCRKCLKYRKGLTFIANLRPHFCPEKNHTVTINEQFVIPICCVYMVSSFVHMGNQQHDNKNVRMFCVYMVFRWKMNFIIKVHSLLHTFLTRSSQ